MAGHAIRRSPQSQFSVCHLGRSGIRADWEEYAPLLDNAYVLGYLNPPHKAAAATPSAEKKPDWDGFFFVYDRSGKETLLAKALLRIGSKGKEQSVSDLTVAGLPATKVTSKTGATYFVNKGKYLISAGE